MEKKDTIDNLGSESKNMQKKIDLLEEKLEKALKQSSAWIN